MTQQVDTKAQLRNLSAEAALLGSLIVNETSLDVVSEHIGANDFSSPKNAAVYSAVYGSNRGYCWVSSSGGTVTKR